MKPGKGTVARVIELLKYIAESENPSSIKDLSESLNLPPTTVHRLINQLVNHGFAERSSERRYRAGKEFSRIGALASQKIELVNYVTPIMHGVVEACDETCLLGIYLPTSSSMMFVHKLDSTSLLRYQPQLFKSRSIAWGASGRAILAWLPHNPMLRAINTAPPSPATGIKLPNVDTLLRQLENIRKNGYAISNGQQTQGAIGLAAPIFNPIGQVIGDLCITIPEYRFKKTAESQLARLLVDGCQLVSKQLKTSAPLEFPRSR